MQNTYFFIISFFVQKSKTRNAFFSESLAVTIKYQKKYGISERFFNNCDNKLLIIAVIIIRN